MLRGEKFVILRKVSNIILIKKASHFLVVYSEVEDMLLTVADFAMRNTNLLYTACTRFSPTRTR